MNMPGIVEITRNGHGTKWVVSVLGEEFSEHRTLEAACKRVLKIERMLEKVVGLTNALAEVVVRIGMEKLRENNERTRRE